MTRIKICGLKDSNHVTLVAELGVDFIGMVFASSPRMVTPQQARQLVETAMTAKSKPSLVGVFANLKPAEVNNVADYCGLDWVQLSGDEDWEYCRLIEKPIIKAIKIDIKTEAGSILRDISHGQRLFSEKKMLFLLDTKDTRLFGGSGKAFDWSLIPVLARELPVLIAGGLNPQNISSLIEQKRPWGVDVSSGLEINGNKDASLIAAFVREVRKSETK